MQHPVKKRKFDAEKKSSGFASLSMVKCMLE